MAFDWPAAKLLGPLLTLLLTTGAGCPGATPQGSDGAAREDGSALLDGGAMDSGQATACPDFSDGSSVGTVGASVLTEVSGLVASRNNPGVLWAHNDAGDAARLYAISTSGALLATCTLSGADAWDYEDLATDGTFLYVADIGDNWQIREYVSIYRVPEPSVADDQPPVTRDLSGVDTLELVYPDQAHDAETLLLDPVDGDLYLVTKESDGDALVFLAPAPLAFGYRVTLQQVASLPFGKDDLPGEDKATGGDVTPDGDGILLRTSDSAFYWRRPAGKPLWRAFTTTTPCPVPLIEEPQGEAICFAADSASYYTLSEGTAQPLYLFPSAQAP